MAFWLFADTVDRLESTIITNAVRMFGAQSLSSRGFTHNQACLIETVLFTDMVEIGNMRPSLNYLSCKNLTIKTSHFKTDPVKVGQFFLIGAL